MKKYTRTEKAEVLSPEQHKVAQDELEKVGKTSASELSDEERNRFDSALRATHDPHDTC